MEKILTFQMLKWKLVAEALDYTVTTYKVIEFRWHDKNGFSNGTYTIQQFCPLLIYKKAVTNTPSIILLTLKLYPQTKRKERYLKPKAFHTTINKFGS